MPDRKTNLERIRSIHWWSLTTNREPSAGEAPRAILVKEYTRLHPQGRWPEGPPTAAHTGLCPTFGTSKLHSSPLKRSKSGPQNLKIVHFWVPFLDRILNVSRAKFGVSRSQKELKMTQKCNNCFGIVRTDRRTDTDRHTHIKILAHCTIGPSDNN